MSITAFPVLARILDETGLLRTPLGTLAIACAAVDDVTAWLLLATGIALARHGAYGIQAGWTLALLVVYAAVILLARPLLTRLVSSHKKAADARLTAVVLACAASAAVTEAIGVHALFGAFFIGLVMPKNRQFTSQVSAALQPLTEFLLPVFFAYTGLRMSVPAFSLGLLLDGLAILVVAALGKGGGAMVAARLAGMTWREATCLGALLNTRGLVELAVLNVGLELHILSPALFSLMVVMALATTAMAVPILRFVHPAIVPIPRAANPPDPFPPEPQSTEVRGGH
jgi:Kef-type K+ transport system membrane component KefB